MDATSCLICLGPETRTPTLDPFISNRSPVKKKSDFNSWRMEIVVNNLYFTTSKYMKNIFSRDK